MFAAQFEQRSGFHNSPTPNARTGARHVPGAIGKLVGAVSEPALTVSQPIWGAWCAGVFSANS